MRSILLSVFLFFNVSCLFSQNSDLFFKPDSGYRVYGAAMGGIYMDENGTVYLYTTSGPAQNLSVSQNGLDFQAVDITSYPDYRALQMPDGTFIRFNVVLENDTAVLKSSSSTDGMHFTQNSKVLFTFPENDHITRSIVYHTNFFNALGGICFIYLAGEIDNARSIYSPPGGEINFGNYHSNIFADSTFGGGSYSFWDPNGILLPDGRLRVITMTPHGPPAPPAERKGTLYTFTSTDSGETWTQDPGYKLRYDSFTEFDVYSLNDPKLVRLPDGRFRIYVAAMIKESDGTYKYSILSATSSEDPTGIAATGTNFPNTFKLFNNYPNPFNPGTTIGYQLFKKGFVNLTVYNSLGQKTAVLVNEIQTSGNYSVSFNGSNLPSGVYFYTLRVKDFAEKQKMVLLK